MKKKLIRSASVLIVLAALILPLVTNTGTVFAATRNLYWVQVGGSGTGNWNDTTHWSLASGGAGGEAIPDSDDNVNFDANSFSGVGQTVTVNVGSMYCQNMDWTGATNSPTFSVLQTLLIYGNVTFISAMSHTGSASKNFGFYGASGTQTFTTGSGTFTVGIYKEGASELSINGALTTGAGFNFKSGTVTTNNNTITCGAFNLNYVDAKTLTLGSSTVNCSSVVVDPTATTLTANTSMINCSGNFNGGGLATWNIVNLTGATSTIAGSNTFSTLALPSGTTQTITFTDGTTQTAETFTLSGSSGHVHTLQGSGVAGWALSDASGTNNYDYISVSRSTAGGGATFNANGASVNGGNNVGWNFPLTTTTQAATGVTMDKDGVTGGTFNGTLVDMGGANDTAWFEYGLTVVYGLETAHVAKTAPTAFTASIPAGLTPGETYHYRSVINNGTDTANGADETFTFTMPTILAVAADNLTTHSARIRANISDLGVATSTYYEFEWGTTVAYGNTTAQQTAVGIGVVTANISGLIQGITYHYRINVINGVITVNGADQSFTTIPYTGGNAVANSVLPILALITIFLAVIKTQDGFGIGMIVVVLIIIVMGMAMLTSLNSSLITLP